MNEKRLGNLYGENCGTGFAGNVWDSQYISPTIMTMGGGNRQPMVLEEQMKKYRIRKLTPLECFRLMGFKDEDFFAAKVCSRERAKEILATYPHEGKRQMDEAERESKMSNSQLYKQAGNSIVVDVPYHIYKELYIAMPYLFDDLKVGSYFSGIGAFESALDRLYDDINNGRIEKGEERFSKSNPFEDLL